MRLIYSIIHHFFPSLIFYVEDSKDWYLTIDDSPSQNTIWLLNLLDSYQVKATFFCIGKSIDAYPEYFYEIQKRGHRIGYHSYEHKNAWRIDLDTLKLDFDKNRAQFSSKMYRPPYGKLTWKSYKYFSKFYKIILWERLAGDWKYSIYPIEQIKSQLTKAKGGCIFVFHDNEKSFKNINIMLPYFLEYAKKNQIVIKPMNY